MTLGTRPWRLPAYASLFASFATLACCALPSLLVLLGFGASVASFLSAAPWLVVLSRHKDWVFAVAGLLIAFNAYCVYGLVPRTAGRGLRCTADE